MIKELPPCISPDLTPPPLFFRHGVKLTSILQPPSNAEFKQLQAGTRYWLYMTKTNVVGFTSPSGLHYLISIL